MGQLYRWDIPSNPFWPRCATFPVYSLGLDARNPSLDVCHPSFTGGLKRDGPPAASLEERTLHQKQPNPSGRLHHLPCTKTPTLPQPSPSFTHDVKPPWTLPFKACKMTASLQVSLVKELNSYMDGVHTVSLQMWLVGQSESDFPTLRAPLVLRRQQPTFGGGTRVNSPRCCAS